jgi:type I restriction enzyme S subunit
MGQAPSGDSYNFDGQGLALIAGAGDFGKTTPEPKNLLLKQVKNQRREKLFSVFVQRLVI